MENIENFFEISPKVEGRFENYGYTTVFIPENKLQPETIYEIIIKKGLTAANGLVALEKTMYLLLKPLLIQRAQPIPTRDIFLSQITGMSLRQVKNL